VTELTRDDRLRSEATIWLATVRPDGRPHLSPIWFVWVEERVWICPVDGAVKTRNVRANASVSVALESGSAPVVGEGVASVVPVADAPRAVRDAFLAKYQWDIGADSEYGSLLSITVRRWLFGA
jgi:PPOX class probable F420-dependent enzyme